MTLYAKEGEAMKRLRNKRFFGMFSVLDILVIAFILVVIMPMLYYYIKFNDKGFTQQKALERLISRKIRQGIVSGAGDRTRQLDVEVSFKNLTRQMLFNIKNGDRETDIDGTVLAEILSLGDPLPDYFIVDTGSAHKSELRKTVPNGLLYALPAKMRLSGTVSTQNGIFIYKNTNIRELEILNFKTKEYEACFAVEGPSVQKN